MAISKIQNERPALIELVDSFNQLEPEIEEAIELVGNLSQDLETETENRTQADTNIQNQIGLGFSSLRTVSQVTGDISTNVSNISSDLEEVQESISNLTTFSDRFKFGLIDSVEVESQSTATEYITFATPYDEGTLPLVVLGFVDETIPTNVDLSIVVTSNDGFSFSVHNGSSEAIDTVVGYIAVMVS